MTPTPDSSAHIESQPAPTSGPERHVPFLAMLGSQRTAVGDGRAVVRLELRPELLNNHGGGHGGVVMALLDSAMANAALSRIGFAREVVTLGINVAFLRPADGVLVAIGRATGGGRSVCFCEGELADGNGTVVATAMGSFRYRDPVQAAR